MGQSSWLHSKTTRSKNQLSSVSSNSLCLEFLNLWPAISSLFQLQMKSSQVSSISRPRIGKSGTMYKYWNDMPIPFLNKNIRSVVSKSGAERVNLLSILTLPWFINLSVHLRTEKPTRTPPNFYHLRAQIVKSWLCNCFRSFATENLQPCILHLILFGPWLLMNAFASKCFG